MIDVISVSSTRASGLSDGGNIATRFQATDVQSDHSDAASRAEPTNSVAMCQCRRCHGRFTRDEHTSGLQALSLLEAAVERVAAVDASLEPEIGS